MSNAAPKHKPNSQCTYHRDGTVSYWDIYSSSWRRSLACELAVSDIMPTLSDRERARIEKMAVRK